jgi:hypothetical protein
MTTYIEVAQALVSAGYLSEADIEAAADVLEDALIIADAEDVQDAASDDYSTQEDIVAKVENWVVDDANAGNNDDLEIDAAIIEGALEQEEIDKDIMVAAETEIAAAYLDAASALLAAELIDEANQQSVAAVIADIWSADDADQGS